MSYGGADLSTSYPNPSVDDYADTTPGTDWTGIANAAGQWGATIASIATNHPVAVAPTYGGGYQTIGAYGSGVPQNNQSQLLIIGIVVVAVFLLLRK